MPNVSTVEMSREEWLKERHSRIGASEIGTVMGLNPFQTPFAIWQEKSSPAPEDKEQTEYMEMGLRLEGVVADIFCEKTGYRVRRDNKIRLHPEFPQFACNLDRTIIAPSKDRGPGVLECKTASYWAMQKWSEEFPLYYITQVMWQMYITGYKWGALALLVDGRKFKYLIIERDENLIRAMHSAAVEFLNMVAAGRAPAMNAEDLEVVLPEPESVATVPEDQIESVASLIENRDRLKAQIADHEKIIKGIDVTLKGMIGDKEVLAIDGRPIVTWKTVTRPGYTVGDKTYRDFRIVKAKKEKKNDEQ